MFDEKILYWMYDESNDIFISSNRAQESEMLTFCHVLLLWIFQTDHEHTSMAKLTGFTTVKK